MNRAANIIATASAAVLAGTSAGQALSFSFASDGDSNTPTFSGNGASVTEFAKNQSFELLVDDANGLLPTLSFTELSLEADFELTFVATTPIIAGLVNHTYSFAGSFAFIDADDNAILSAMITGGVLNVLGTETSWSTSGSFAATDLGSSDIRYEWNGPEFADYGLFDGAFSEEDNDDDGAFTLTLIEDAITGAAGVEIDRATGLPGEWTSEASFSGSATFVPTPGALALVAIGGITAVNRRR